MRVWLVWDDDPGPGGRLDLIGVFSSERSAKEFIDSHPLLRRVGMTFEEVATDMELVP